MTRQPVTKPSVKALDRLLEEIAAGRARMPILLQGDEEYRVEQARKRVIAAFFPHEGERRDAVETISARDHDAASIVARASEAPLFASRHALVVRDAELLAKTASAGAADDAPAGEGKGKGGRTRVARRVPATVAKGAPATGRDGTWANLPADAILLLVARPGIDRRTRLYKEIETTGSAITFDRIKDPAEAAEWVEDLFRYHRKSIDADGRRLLLEKTLDEGGVSLRLLASEIDKLISYAGSRARISRADVEILVGKSTEEEIWAVARAVGERSPQKALAALDHLVEQNEPMLVVMANLAGEFRALLDARLAWEAIPDPRLREAVRRNFETFKERVLAALQAEAASGQRPLLRLHPYVAWLKLQAAVQLDVPTILGAIRELAVADRDLKGSGRPERLIMESLVVRLSGRGAA